MKKYKLRADLTIKHGSKTLFRVEATIDFGNVKKGELGGYIEKEDNLSQAGNAWVTGNAEISKPHHLVFISGFKFGVTVLHCQVQVGCRLVMLDEIDSIKYEDVRSEGVSEFEFEALKVMINVALEYVLTKISEE